jgi:DNA-binding transcriptional LysR family regulator
MLHLARLRLLRELDARGTVHAVAGALGYTPSAVSQQLAVLEREAGTPLIERAGRGVRLTDAGRVLAAHAGRLLAAAEAAEAELSELDRAAVAGTVRVAAFQSAMLRIVAPAVAAVAESHPAVRVEVTELEVEEAVPALRLQQLDAVIGDEYDGLPRPRWRDLDRERLLREEMRLVLPEDHPLAVHRRVPLRWLADAAWAATQPGTGHREMHVRTCRVLGDFEPDLRHASDDFLILLELVRTTGACALLPAFVGADEVPGVAVRPLEEGTVGREIYLVTRRPRSRAVEVVAEALRDAAAVAGGPAAPPTPVG